MYEIEFYIDSMAYHFRLRDKKISYKKFIIALHLNSFPDLGESWRITPSQ